MNKRFYPGSVALPTTTTAVGWLLLDRLKAPSWGYGVFWTLIALVWIAVITTIAIQVFGDSEVLSADEIERRLRTLEGRIPFGPKP